MEKNNENNIINNLLNTLNKLNEGTYTECDTKIKKDYTKAGFYAEISINSNNYSIGYNYSGEYTICKKIDEFSSLHHSRNFSGIISEFIYSALDNHHYHMYEHGLSKDDEKYCNISNNVIRKQLDENTFIGYNLSNDKAYVFYKKFDVLDESDNLAGDYIKYEYNSFFVEERDAFNNKLKDLINSFISEMELTRFESLANSINTKFRKLNDNLLTDINSLKELGGIYNKYKENFDLANDLDNINDFNDIIEFANKLIDNPYEAKENCVKNLINNIDLKDSSALMELKHEINDLIKLQKNNTKKKTK